MEYMSELNSYSSFQKKQLLFVTAFHPGGQGHIGAGEAISEQHLKAFLDDGFDVHVLCFAPRYQSRNPDVVNLCKNYITIDHDVKSSIKAIFHCFKQGSLIAPWFFSRVSDKNLKTLNSILLNYNFHRVHLDFPSCLGFSKYIIHKNISYTAHDVVSQKLGRHPIFKIFHRFFWHIESSLLKNLRSCIVLSDKDAELVNKLGFDGEVIAIPPINIRVGKVYVSTAIVDVVKQFENHKNIVYFGNMRRQENNLSIIRFLLCSFPFIWIKNKGIRFWILGLSPRLSLKIVGYLFPGVKVVGAVDDPTDAFKSATVCIAPVYYGAGVKIKVIQMLESGASVISTQAGAEGIPKQPNLIVVDGWNFIKAVNDYVRT